MRSVRLSHDVDLDGFRAAARAAVAANVRPETIRFLAGDETQGDLLAEAAPAGPALADAAPLSVPRRFGEMADLVARHRDPGRYDLLYAALCRLREMPGLLDIASDPLVARLEAMARAVRRDRHKMTAFVRFREIASPDGPRFVAFFEPQHFIEELAAPFFVDRFASMRFAILTPRASIVWDGALSFGPGGRPEDAPPLDAFADAWSVYYRSIFNPARLMQRAMLKEMPKRYWVHLPETREIVSLADAARRREAAMIAAAPSPPDRGAERVAARFAESRRAPPPAGAYEALRAEAKGCASCPLAEHATQVVFGEGPTRARAIFVGEQPGDQEDLAGRPFVGPAGVLLRGALREAGFAEGEVYLTGAVKHFKFEPRGKRRIHKTPNAGEIDRCRFWLDRELQLVEAPLIVTLGASALRAVAGPQAKLADARGGTLTVEGRTVLATIHPAYLLRLPDAGRKEAETRAFAADLAKAAALSLNGRRLGPGAHAFRRDPSSGASRHLLPQGEKETEAACLTQGSARR
jgi:DNA polymerase